MDHADIVNISIATGATFVTSMSGLIAWLWRHSSRLMAAEVRIQGLSDNAEQDRRRSDTQTQQIIQSLIRIEDKLDRKADR